MAAPYYLLAAKASRALQAYIRNAAVDGLNNQNVIAHKDIQTRAFPNVTIRTTRAAPMSGNPGCWSVDVMVHVVASMAVNPDDSTADPISASDDLSGRVFDLFFCGIVGEDNSGLADLITTAARAAATAAGSDAASAQFACLADFKCDHIRHSGGIEINTNEDGTAYVDVLPLQMVVRTSTETEP